MHKRDERLRFHSYSKKVLYFTIIVFISLTNVQVYKGFGPTSALNRENFKPKISPRPVFEPGLFSTLVSDNLKVNEHFAT